jgi:hypothetical protein
MQATWATGPPPAFSIDLSICIGRRSVTAVWPHGVVQEVCAAVDATSGDGAGALAAAPARAVAAA